MKSAWFRFYEELNDFLPSGRRKKSSGYLFAGNPSVKDAIEAQGIPHTEVDMILINGISVDFSCKLNNGDNVSVYPVFESFDISGLTRLRKEPLRDIRFILDVHLGKLARYLRLAGYDALYSKEYVDIEIIKISLAEKRIILTRDKGLLKNRKVTHGYWIRSTRPAEQFTEVFEKFSLHRLSDPFTLCLDCNTQLMNVSKEEIEEQLLPATKKHFDNFKKCPHCNKVYWEGSHYLRMAEFVNKIINSQFTE